MKLVLLALVATIVGAAIAIPMKEYLYPTNGGIITVGVTVIWAEGPDTGKPVETVYWGDVENSTAYVLDCMNITNSEDIDVTLTLTTQDLSPSIISLGLTWNYTDGTVLTPASNDAIIVQLTQTVTATGDWSYTTVITATEATP